MFICSFCGRKVKTKSSLNRHMKEACKAKKKKTKRPTIEIDIGSPSGVSQVSALGNPEYLPDASLAVTTGPVIFAPSIGDGFSPMTSSRKKRVIDETSGEESRTVSRSNPEPLVLDFEDLNNLPIHNSVDVDDVLFAGMNDDLSADVGETSFVVQGPDTASDGTDSVIISDREDSLFGINDLKRMGGTDVEIYDDGSENTLSSGSANSSCIYLAGNDSGVDDVFPFDNIRDVNGTDVEKEFFEYDDFIDVSQSVNSDTPINLRIEEELLLHIIKDEHLPPHVFDRIMKWGKFCRENDYDFSAPGFRTAMKRWKEHYMNSALKAPALETVCQDWQSVPSQIPVIDPLPQIIAILNDTELMEGALWSSDVRLADDGSRLYGDINTGKQWCMAEDRMKSRIDESRDPHSACHHHCGVLLFDDNTLGDGLGRLQIQPVLGTICILPKKSRRNVKGWFILGIVPPYPRTSQERTADRNKNASKHQYLQWYHACLEKILAPLLRLCANEKGFPFLIGGKCRILHFELSGIIGDTKGHAEMCANYNAHSSVISKCNRDCDIPQRNADDPFFTCARTQANDVYVVVEDALKVMHTTDHANKAARDESKRLLKSISQHPVLPYYRNFSFCGDPEGVFGCTPWELLHVWYLGIMKLILTGCYNFSRSNEELVKWYRHRLCGHAKGDLSMRPTASCSGPGSKKNSVLFPKPKLEERLRLIQTYSRRQSDRYMPRGPFREGVTDLTRLSGQEYPGLLLFSMVSFKGIFHNTRLEKEEGPVFAADLERRMCLLCFLALSLDVEMTLENISEKRRIALEAKVKIFLDFFRCTLGVAIEYSSQTGLRRPKFHAALHIVRDVIPKYGSTTNTFGGYLESFLRIIAKEPLKRTSRKHGTFQWELMNRYSEELVRRASKERLAQRGYDVAGGDIRDNSLSVADSGSSRSQMTNTTSKGRWFTPGGTVFYCSKNKDSGAWGMFNSDGTSLSDGLHHPGYPGNAKARKWVIAMVKAAENLSEVADSVVGPNYDRIDFTYHLKTPNSNDDAHDLFRCHPNFHGSSLKRNPWHDWAMIRYEVMRNGESYIYDVAAKILLWGVFRNTEADVSSSRLDVYGAFHPMKEYQPRKDETMPFLTKDVLADDIEVLSFDTVVSTAYVLPILWSRTNAFPKTSQEVTAYCVVPPRSQWPDIGWDDKLLTYTARKDTKKLPFV